jgi:glutaredoxin
MTKRWLETRNIPYAVVDATADENVADSIRSLAASDGNTGKVQMPYVQYSTGDAETDFHWFGFIPAHLEKYATTITQEAA